MAGARWQDHNVAGTEFECATALAAKPNFGATARDPKHLVNARVIVQIVVDAIAPAVAPAVVLEQVSMIAAGSSVRGSCTAFQ